MHEWALAETIVKCVLELFRGKNIVKLRLSVGRLQNVDREILLFNVKELLKVEGYSNVEVILRDTDVSLMCRNCSYTWSVNFEDLGEDIAEMIHFIPESIYAYVKCPVCSSRDFEIVSGRGVYVEEVEFLEAGTG